MTRIFFDANIIIDWLNKDAAENQTCLKCIESCIYTGGTLLISPTTLAIAFYFVSKRVKNKKQVLNKLEESMKLFKFTTEDAKTVEQSFDSAFLDLEDALQYFSAVGSMADAIVTYNVKDFTHCKIPVYHPHTYLTYFE